MKKESALPAPQMNLEQIHALSALLRHRSIAASARATGRTETQLIYALKTLESLCELPLIDRSEYRTQLTSVGKRLAEKCDQVLTAYKDLERVALLLRKGWEPSLAVVYDGIIAPALITGAIAALQDLDAPTRVTLFSEFHSEVGERFAGEKADIMITVIPFALPELQQTKIGQVTCHLVARRGHPAVSKTALTPEAMSRLPLLTVRGSDFRLQLETGKLASDSVYHLSDFQAKRQAILDGLGYGWLQDHMIAGDLAKRSLIPVNWQGENSHTFDLLLFHRPEQFLGPAAKVITKILSQSRNESRQEQQKMISKQNRKKLQRS
jgi:DNA-binding transcriptional LysR family regulator